MHTLQYSEATGNWQVGFYTPDGSWHIVETTETKALAFELVNCLNGGAMTNVRDILDRLDDQ